MSLFKVNSIFLIKDMEQKSKTVSHTHEVKSKNKIITQTYEESFTGSITAPKELRGRIEKILKRDCINRKETEYVVRVWDPKEDENNSIVKNYKESYLARYASLLT